MSVQVAEFVGRGHPDKIADIIADRLVEEALKIDLRARCAFEVLASKGVILVAGEVSNHIKDNANFDIEKIVIDFLEELGYKDLDDWKIINNTKEQSPDIVSSSIEGSEGGIVSGDQSICIGYACDENDKYLPTAYLLIRKLITNLCGLVEENEWIKQDCKGLVVLKDRKIDELILSVQHDENVDIEQIRKTLYEYAFDLSQRSFGLNLQRAREICINTSEKFVIGGLEADTGLTNRKIVSDCYGTAAHHGGGGLSGKDLTKVDRLGAYYARWICVNMVASGVCKELELELIYKCGSWKPSFRIINKRSKYTKTKLLFFIEELFIFDFEEVYEMFNKPSIEYSLLAEWGHFGNNLVDCPWERTNMKRNIEELEKSILQGILSDSSEPYESYLDS